MPVAPYVVEITAYDVDGSTLLSGAEVNAWNVTQECWIKPTGRVTTNASGQALLDLANFTNDYADGDKVQIVIESSEKLKSIDIRHTINTVTGSHSDTVYVHDGGAINGTVYLRAYHAVNKDASSKREIELYDRENDVRVKLVHLSTNDHDNFNTGSTKGLLFSGGIARIFSADDADFQITIVTDRTA